MAATNQDPLVNSSQFLISAHCYLTCFDQQKSQMQKLGDTIQFFGTEKEDRTTDHHKVAKQTVGTMVSNLGYCETCARQSILFLLKAKY